MNVNLYTVPNCPLCEDVRMQLRALGVAYSELDVTSNYSALRAMYRLTRQRLVPVVEANGRAITRPDTNELREFIANQP